MNIISRESTKRNNFKISTININNMVKATACEVEAMLALVILGH
jgi:hypothetical protein